MSEVEMPRTLRCPVCGTAIRLEDEGGAVRPINAPVGRWIRTEAARDPACPACCEEGKIMMRPASLWSRIPGVPPPARFDGRPVAECVEELLRLAMREDTPAPRPQTTPPDPSRGLLPFPASADRGHVWQTDASGEAEYVEPVADDGEGHGHGGPCCARCGYWFCEHCHPDGPPEECDGEPA